MNFFFFFNILAWEFRNHGDARTSRRLFRFSLIHLPILMTLMLVSKKHWFINTEKKENSQLSELKEKGNFMQAISRLVQASA